MPFIILSFWLPQLKVLPISFFFLCFSYTKLAVILVIQLCIQKHFTPKIYRQNCFPFGEQYRNLNQQVIVDHLSSTLGTVTGTDSILGDY